MKFRCEKCNTPCMMEVTGNFCGIPSVCPWDPIKPAWTKVDDETPRDEFDNVTKPSHYCEGRKYEPLAVIEDWQLDFHTGNALKYIARAGRKNDELEDLAKAKFYIERKIKQIEKERVI